MQGCNNVVCCLNTVICNNIDYDIICYSCCCNIRISHLDAQARSLISQYFTLHYYNLLYGLVLCTILVFHIMFCASISWLAFDMFI